ncbi:hypothetical protein [Duganella sp. BJB1802]|uniref:hypothetical protein n=1 Tax=Duganella sp. BJB1802 TaxID=2744575 RepID=UPI001E4E6741|nr:hypothetical protein [Duganella sp. BJB1802]
MRWLTAEDFAAWRRQLRFRGFIVTVILFGVELQSVARRHGGRRGGHGLLYMRTGKLWVAIAAHAVTNGVLGVWIIRTCRELGAYW